MDNDSILAKFFRGNLVLQIFIGIILGLLLAYFNPEIAKNMQIFGDLFVSALKAVAPILVFILVLSAIANQQVNTNSNMRPIIILYLIGTLLASLTAVGLSFLFPSTLSLNDAVNSQAPQGITEVLKTLLFNVVTNPIQALLEGNYIGILAWAIGLGITLRHAGQNTKTLMSDLSNGVTNIVRVIIRFAPIGIFGLVSVTVAGTGFTELSKYLHLIAVLLGAMLIVALIINPILVLIKTHKNPYPLIFTCLRESGVTAFFTRSSAANIPVNMALCEKLKLDPSTYSVSIPLGATINMAGAAITITVLTLAAVHTQGIEVDIFTALLLSVIAAISACGASGVAGGSLLLIPLACSLFGISDDIALQVVGVGFVIGVIQDSAETALNSSTDVVFTAAVSQANETQNI